MIYSIYKFLKISAQTNLRYLVFKVYRIFFGAHVGERLVKLITPYNVFGFEEKMRLGNEFDGGYVIPVRILDNIDVVYSYGVGRDISFEEDLIKRVKVPIRLFDHSINKLPIENELFYFLREGIANKSSYRFNTFKKHVIDLGDAGKKLMLKMDIEGDEIGVLFNQNFDFKNVSVFLLEVHDLNSLFKLQKYLKIFEELNKSLTLVHVHANNFRPCFKVDAKIFPSVLELTYINNDLVHGKVVMEQHLPSLLDFPSLKTKEDYVLNYWINI